MQLASPPKIPVVIENQPEEFRALRNPVASRLREALNVPATSKKRGTFALARNEPNEHEIKRRVIAETKLLLFKPRRQNNDLPPVPDATVSFLRSLSND